MTSSTETVRDAPARRDAHGSADESPMSHRQIMEAMSGLMLALLVAILSSTIVSNALPRIIADLNGTQGQYTWVVTAMLLTSTASTPIWGKLSDLFSKKLLYQLAIVIFTVGSVAGGFAQSMETLIGFRALQGIGMGGLQALIQVVIAAMVSPRDRGRYSGYIGATFAVATVSGPLVGGVIVDTAWLGWRWCFWVTVPIAVIAFIVLGRTLKLPVIKRPVKIDWFGALFLVGGVSLLLVWVSLAGKSFEWWSAETAAYVGGGVLALIIAVIIESRVSEPIVPLRMFRNPTVTLATIGTVAVGTAMFGGSVFLGQYFQISRSMTPTEAGLMTLPMVGGMFLSSTISGQVISRVTGKIKPFLVAGSVVMVAAMWLLSTMDHETNLWLVGVYLFLMGTGVGMLMQNLVLAVQNATSARDMGSVTSVVTFFRTLGGSAGVSVLGAVLATQVSDYIVQGLAKIPGAAQAAGGSGGGTLNIDGLPEPIQVIVRAAYGDAIGDIFFISACVAVVTFVAVLFLRETPLRTTIDSHEEREAVAVAAHENAVDNPTRPVDNSAATNGSPQVPLNAEPVDNSVDRRSEAWSEPVAPRRYATNGRHLAGELGGAGLHVHGTVQDSAGSPVGGVVLTLTDANGRQVERARTDQDGQFQLSVAHGGTYVLIASGGSYQPTASMVVVGDRPVRHDVQLLGAGRLVGLVHVGGVGVAGAMVVLTDVRGEVVATTATAADGHYAFGDLVGGSYALTVTAPNYRPVASSVTVADGEQTTADVVLQSGAQLTGVVRSASLGVAVPDARVTLLNSGGAVVGAATTDVDGNYTFTDLPDGEYTVIATGYPPVASSLRLAGEASTHDVELGYPETD
ncbi:drug resistance transporter, EmrB/QacA subfamily [Saccharopolyspora kobensis]|uniref:Drug resistance transporter, EmrB/QacA subfamily n=1 Tax=Saccharopolyspora kobensis TaxID=146035 RepID=A0A1H6E3H5_9PSEU|nr:MFS transporter [Saccharopolyspora kobensis]SEG91445.1 drug resistance transporter, EmrB/QacA subfamily [Saccharopolyspora kobensis]SFF15548.1 drug resistance transporter, EmrB/QacA subfamily [Saccharopolyspora kobensis]